MNKTFITNSEEDTQKLGEEFVGKLNAQDVILLIGELGAGKTTFVKGLALGLGVPNRVISPTYTVLRTYTTKNNNIKKVFHLDLYRLESESDVKNIALDELIADPEAVTLIEWPEKAKNIQAKNIIKINFEHLYENSRKITFNYGS